MIYYVKSWQTGQIYKGKFVEGGKQKFPSLTYGDVLYNPYTKETIWGWNNYKKSMRESYKKRFGR